MSSILMHICCAPDATVGYERLSKFGAIYGLFYNPNIEPVDEYNRRLREAEKLAGMLEGVCMELPAERGEWFEAVKGFESEPERGERCRRCISNNLTKAAEYAAGNDIKEFATTLTASRFKDVDFIHEVGQRIADDLGLVYLDETLRKKDGVRRAEELSKEMGIYRQNYCGCRWSLRDRDGDPSLRSG